MNGHENYCANIRARRQPTKLYKLQLTKQLQRRIILEDYFIAHVILRYTNFEMKHDTESMQQREDYVAYHN